MAIIKTITYDYEFAEWLKRSDGYKNNFTLEGANALQQYIYELSEELETDIEFDPVAWCVEYTEYDSATDAYNSTLGFDDDQRSNGSKIDEDEALEKLRDYTTVIELDSGGVVIADF